MSKLLYRYDESPNSAIEDAVEDAVAQAKKKLSNDSFEGWSPESGLGISYLRPAHVGIGSKHWIGTAVAAAWYSWLNAVTVDEDAFLVITGIFDRTANPVVTEMHFSDIAGRVQPLQNIEILHTPEFDGKGFFAFPLIIGAKKKFTLALWTEGAIQTIRFGLMGFTIATAAYLQTA